MTPQELIAALDSFGLYASEVMRELHGDFTQYVKRMEDAAQVLGDLTDTLKREVTEENWDAFADDIFSLNTHGNVRKRPRSDTRLIFTRIITRQLFIAGT